MMNSAYLTVFSVLIFGTAISLAQDTQKIPQTSITQKSSIPDDSREPIGKGINLISFTVGRFQDSKQFLEIPITSPGDSPKVVIQHPSSGYRWVVDNFQRSSRGDFLQAEATDNKVKEINNLKIQPNQLFVKAEVTPNNSKSLYIPVILNRGAKKYEFVFYCNQCTASISTAKMIASRVQNCSVSSNPVVTRVECDGQKLPRGRFRLSLSGNLKMSGSNKSELLADGYSFRHNPEWLK